MRLIYYDFGDGFLADHHLFHAIDELSRKGHDVIYVNPMKEIGADATVDACCELLMSRIRTEHDNGGIDLFFSVAWDNALTPETVRDISRMGIPTVSFSTDDLSHPFRVQKITPAFDLCWTSAKESTNILRGYGAKQIIAMPFAANPHYYRPISTPEKNCICFIGTAYGARARGIATMAQADLPVHVHGASPMDVYGKNRGNPVTRALTNLADTSERFFKGMAVPGGRKCIQAAFLRSAQELFSSPPEKDPTKGNVSYLGGAGFEEMAQIFSQSALSFGSIEVASTFVLKEPLLFIRVREFEVAMSGGVHLVNRCPELEEYFEEDAEMIYYDSFDELVDKARFYLDTTRQSLRSSIRKAAARRALADHTWSHRFDQVGKRLGLSFDAVT